jgi:hypothetical protein
VDGGEHEWGPRSAAVIIIIIIIIIMYHHYRHYRQHDHEPVLSVPS